MFLILFLKTNAFIFGIVTYHSKSFYYAGEKWFNIKPLHVKFSRQSVSTSQRR